MPGTSTAAGGPAALSDEQVRFFHDNGYFIMRGFIARDEIDALRGATDELQRQAIAKLQQPGYLDAAKRLNGDWIEHPDDHFVYREKPDGAISFHRIERMFTRQEVFRSFAMHPRLLGAAWRLIDRPFWPRAGSLVVKLPHEGAAVRWHQDIPYLYWSSGGHPGKGRSTTHEVPNFTTDIYLEESNRSNGCLYAVPGTHADGTRDVDRMVAENGGEMPAGAVPLELKPGDIMFHHTALVHGSPENHSPSLRRTYYIHYMADATVEDAYSDWPDLLDPDENIERWSDAMQARAKRGESLPFTATREGLRPR